VSEKMTLWGVGPAFAVISILLCAAALLVHFYYIEYFKMAFLPPIFFVIPGIVLLMIGIPLWFISGRMIVKGFNEGRLVTQGTYAIVRHPLYASFIVFNGPGIALLFRSWIMLAVPLLMYVFFKILIRKEEDYLEREFGEAYQEYKSKVNAVLPIPKFW
jgi:protein-S-isoprenylcysteine O-methyltransferase Ste14